ncbi:hypothetical protein P168DRAFT_270237 [Aspergillus campestris IBT 28561]|uniref:SNF2 family helicase n=1 Tax=Aspergillus campestris (strain IBT 28561) TaxID=1392248 RepID=A0A2I1D1J5_ASPC2|nr:uncharacterized protein P168DRAFT_270237 [Aspergillus campestris IBT 28561]PKY03745.1 hypothetical protein P168DRAFT_270237 [Aspergillus campestris IBT 28561]
MEDRFRYEVAKLDDDARQKRLANRKVLEEQRLVDDEELPFNEYGLGNTSQSQLPYGEESGNPGASDTKPSVSRRKRSNKITASEKRRSMQVGFDVVLAQAANKRKPRKRRHDCRHSSTQRGPMKKSKKNDEENAITLRSFFGSSLTEDAHANSPLPEIPGFTAKNKGKALFELIASIPTIDQKGAASDKQQVLKATRKFTKSATSDGKSGWKIRGLKTSLYHHQLLGAAFMRDRENSTHAPFGGFLCDFMGFGKTIQALANIMDGQTCDPNDPLRTTLIVVPAHLVSHWRNQIAKHCDADARGEVKTYNRHLRQLTLDIDKSIQNSFILRSYPRCMAPEQPMDENTTWEWWIETYEKHAGPLHRNKFLRIILDEGHVINNYTGHTSIAVRALTGKYKWILSGTPVHNCIEEFYPQFDFLSVPQTGNFDTFFGRYCKASDQKAEQRLTNLLRSFMIKRTHQSRLFSLPVIKLPDLGEEVVKVNFCEAERTIYERIVDYFIKNMNGHASVEDGRLAQTRCFLTMLLVLRMFCSHILTTQGMVKKLLSGSLMRELMTISNDEDEVTRHTSKRITSWLVAMKRDTGLGIAKQPDSEEAGQLLDEIRGDAMKLVQRFHELMCQLHEREDWDERLARTSCATCASQPVNTVVTDCMHLYCEECFYLLGDDTNSATPSRVCVKCTSHIEEAAQCCFNEDIELGSSSLSQATASVGRKQAHKRKRNTKRNSGNALRKIATPRTEESDESEDEDEKTDWIRACDGDMPGAKLSKIQEIIRGWIEDNPDVKIVVFTQFLNFVQNLAAALRRENCPSVCLTGKMRPECREESMKKFAENPNIRVMIASLKAGGTGLDMTAANKCILVDLWWNGAMQDQAFCRVWRIGQTKSVQCVKMIVEDSIDEYILKIQARKAAEISNTMGLDVLKDRDTVRSLLEMFGATVEENENGAFIVTRNRK